jgi:hypothetical protein
VHRAAVGFYHHYAFPQLLDLAMSSSSGKA